MQECFGDSAAWIPYIRPGLHALAPGRRGRAREPRPQARRARQARPRRLGRQRRGGLPPHDRGHQPGGRVRQRAHRRHAALRRPPPGARTRATRAELLHELLPGDPRRGLERAREAAHARHLRRARSSSSPRPRPSTSSPSAPRAPTTSSTPSACRCGSPTTPRPTTPTRCASASPSARTRSAPTTATTSRPTATTTTEPADPDPRIVLIQHLGLVSTGTTTKNSTVSRDLYHRAIEVMAGAQALGEFVSLDAAESFAIEYWPLELYKLAQAPPPGELQGQVALVTGGAGRHRPRDRRLARRRGRVRRRVRPRPVRRRGRRRGLRRRRAGGQRRRHERGRGAPPPSPPPSTASAASTSSSPTPASRPARRSRRRRSTSGTATTTSS